MATKKIKRKNYYETIGKKEEFWRKIEDKTHKTNQDELERASISVMAEKYGIEAIQRKAEQMYIEAGALQDKLFGHDLTNMNTVKEEILNTKNKLGEIFNLIPARLRKTLFNDNVGEFVNSYINGDEQKLTELSKHGLVSEKQLNKVKIAREQREAKRKEEETKIRFAELIKQKEGELYETFKKTGNIAISNQINNTDNNTNV